MLWSWTSFFGGVFYPMIFVCSRLNAVFLHAWVQMQLKTLIKTWLGTRLSAQCSWQLGVKTRFLYSRAHTNLKWAWSPSALEGGDGIPSVKWTISTSSYMWDLASTNEVENKEGTPSDNLWLPHGVETFHMYEFTYKIYTLLTHAKNNEIKQDGGVMENVFHCSTFMV